MSAGRTSWFPRDAAWHRRELIVELGDEFGPVALAVLTVIDAWAQEQRSGGEVKGGYRVLAREAFVTVSHAESLVVRASALGVLDDLEVADDGRRFTCRVSGWESDQAKGRAAVRQADKRNRDGDTSEQPVTVSPVVTVSALPNLTREEKREEANASSKSAEADEVREDVRSLCALLGNEIVANDQKAKPAVLSKGWCDSARLMLDTDQRPYDEAVRLIRWCQSDSFWRANILSMPKLREKYAQLLLKMNAASSGTGRQNQPSAEDFLQIARGAA